MKYKVIIFVDYDGQPKLRSFPIRRTLARLAASKNKTIQHKTKESA